MRDIKFRAWHLMGKGFRPKEAGMIYDEKPGDCLVWKNQGQEITDIMQYAGLKDKNGKEIYEGDVVKSQTGRICKIVYFSSPSFCGWDLIALNCGGRPPLDRMWEGWGVIGNIHENPELLEKLVMREL